MTVRELIAELEKHDPSLIVRYEYDEGFAYPTFNPGLGPFICLYTYKEDDA